LKNNTLIVILGPTASGKTDIAIRLAERLGTEIISADSRQFYKEMRIGTAKPEDRQLSRVRHYFIGNLSVTDYYNVARYETEALETLKKIYRQHKYAVMVGGSGLYIDAVCKGIDELPDPDPELRDHLRKELKEKGINHLQNTLKELDPEYFSMVDINNPNRIIRALEVCKMTGRPYSTFRTSRAKKRDFNIRKFGVDITRQELNQRISDRVDRMMESGLLKEVSSLYHYCHLNALNTVGYRELFEYLDGKGDLNQAVNKIKTNTRRYAKRQMTWFKKDNEVNWLQSWEDLLEVYPSNSLKK
jgi:tRNA dimethylallyltransferase